MDGNTIYGSMRSLGNARKFWTCSWVRGFRASTQGQMGLWDASMLEGMPYRGAKRD